MREGRNKHFIRALGPLLALVVWILPGFPGDGTAQRMAGVAVWMCTWWFTEAVGFGVTAMVPVIMLPLLGIANIKDVARQYSDSIIFLFLGGFMLAFAIEKWGFHRRIAFRILALVGKNPTTILFGLMVSTFLISNWISNTATTMMLFSAVLALIHETRPFIARHSEKFAAALLLGLAFSATIGGMATPVGTPPNMYFFSAYQNAFGDDGSLTFFSWTAIGFPIATFLLLVTFAVLNQYFIRNKVRIQIERTYFGDAYRNLGIFTREEKWVAGIFAVCILLWLTRADVNFGAFQYRGWTNLFPKSGFIDDAMVAMAAALLLFIIPSTEGGGKTLLDWDDAKKLRYDIILMFGSGFALAYGFEVSGLSGLLAGTLSGLKNVSPLIIVISVCVVVTLISEFASNIASVQLAIPVMMALHKELDIHPLLLMMPATFAASLGFMLPVATAANTIVVGTRMIPIRDMFRVGIILDLAGITIIAVMCYLYLS